MVKGMPGDYDGTAMDDLFWAMLPTRHEIQTAATQELKHLMFDRGITELKAYEMTGEHITRIVSGVRDLLVHEAQMALVQIREESK